MKTFASLAFGIASSIGACIAVTSLASAIVADPEAHKLDTLSSPDLWTNKPVRIDVVNQRYERVPAAHSTYVTDPLQLRVAASNPDSTLKTSVTAKPTLSAEHLNWCGARYRSYDPASNSYRAHSGATKTCLSPYAALEAVESGATQAGSALAAGGAAMAWCAARYQSYRASDNSYQPYNGPRRTCVPPARQEVASSR
ncbi:BA14K family protein [Rhizobium grahamii]|uniref:Lectin-like protein BA14k n=1 Tax=Rhizobium grahamii TaxID=1120045 RepID=A0A370KIB8_9HYPH|nr:BA14K family protein [Rhizobium grahamii]RDJ05638.1 BA14K family protein [Rhizobium grahamii]